MEPEWEVWAGDTQRVKRVKMINKTNTCRGLDGITFSFAQGKQVHD